MNSDIMKISRLRMGTDGRGITTLVAFFGCPLQCKYCINNECHKNKNRYLGINIPRASYTAEELMHVLRKDDIYYKMSGGGIVFGGGEPLLQAEFISDVCDLADPLWKIRIETSLNVPWENIEKLIDRVDEWIIDIKDMNPKIYRAYTDADIHLLRYNLLKFRKYVETSKIHIRIPHIPSYNTEDDVKKSTDWIQQNLGVKPEIFHYQKTPQREYEDN